MDSDRIDRMVSALRERGIMAHRADEGLYEFGIRVIIPDGSEALWTVGGAAGLDAEVLRDNTLIGYVPHVPGSESLTDEQTVDVIAATRYSEEGMYPASRTVPPPHPADPRPATHSRPRQASPVRHRDPWHPHRLRWPHR